MTDEEDIAAEGFVLRQIKEIEVQRIRKLLPELDRDELLKTANLLLDALEEK